MYICILHTEDLAEVIYRTMQTGSASCSTAVPCMHTCLFFMDFFICILQCLCYCPSFLFIVLNILIYSKKEVILG
jgi:hypothetical protein